MYYVNQLLLNFKKFYELLEMLRKLAEHSMIKMIIAIFERLKSLEDDLLLTESLSTDEPADPVHMNTPKDTSSLDVSIQQQPTIEESKNQGNKPTNNKEIYTTSPITEATVLPTGKDSIFFFFFFFTSLSN